MTTSILRLTAAGVTAIALAACGNPDPGVEADRSDRTRAVAEPGPATTDAQPVTTEATGASTTTGPITTGPITTEAASTEPPRTEPLATDPVTTDAPAQTTVPDTVATERPPAPAASGPGSVSADDLESVFLPANPDLLGAASTLTDGRDAPTFLDEEMTFTGMDPVIEIAGAPITLAAYSVGRPTFDDSGEVTGVSRFRTRYRMAVEVENDDIDEFASALRDELRPIVEAANPDEVVTDTLGEAALGNSIYGLRVGPEDDPSTLIEIDQHYVIVPRLVNDLLLAVRVIRVADGNDIVPAELPVRERFVNDELQAQFDLFQAVADPVSEPTVDTYSVIRNIPSAGAPTTNRSTFYDVAIPADGFEEYVDSFATVVEADDYEGVENFGNERSFDHVEERIESEFVVELDGDAVTVFILGDTTAYPD